MESVSAVDSPQTTAPAPWKLLILKLKDDNPFVRKSAAYVLSLSSAKREDVKKALKLSLTDEDEGVRMEARKALKSF